MSVLTREHLLDALRTVNDPDLNKDLVTLNMIKRAQVRDEGIVDVTVELTTPACPLKDKIRSDVERAISAKAASLGAPISALNVEFTADVRSAQERAADKSSPLPGVRNIIAVGAGKGGVGKSTIAVNLAVGLARFGARVGLLDADIYGPSMPTMLGLTHAEVMVKGNMIQPFESNGIKVMTIGKLVEPEKPLIWRGPMAHGAFRQLATQTEWGELDYLIIDLPPGTGDVPLTMSQLLPLAGAVVVCTPQRVAQDDARRAVRMFEQLGVPLLGVVENMSSFICEHGTEYDIFGKGGAEEMARELNVPFLGAVPLVPRLRENSDEGYAMQNFEGSGPLPAALTSIVQNVAAQVSMLRHKNIIARPTISIS